MANKYFDVSGLSHLWAAISARLNNKSDKNHTHKYAGSSSAGGAATKAISDKNGSDITQTYATKAELEQAISALNFGFVATEEEM